MSGCLLMIREALVSSAISRADGWVSGENQQTVNLPLLAGYGGSNPPPSTIRASKTWCAIFG